MCTKGRVRNSAFVSLLLISWLKSLYLSTFFWAPKSLQIVIAAMKLKDAYSLEGKL